jgi:hypothetical protein
MLNNERQKIILLACPQGRIGSSMVMGLLKISGVYVGDHDKLTKPKAMNQKGFFELKTHNQLLSEIFPKAKDLFAPPSLDEVERLKNENSERYLEWFEQEFGDQTPVAIKSPQLLSILFFLNTNRTWDIRIILLKRNFVNQAKSLKRVWRNNEYRKNLTVDEIVAWLIRWQNFALQLLDHYNLEYLDLSFDELLDSPLVTSSKLFDFLEIHQLSDEEILDWVDPKLVNQNAMYDKSFLQKLKGRLRNIRK